MNVIDIKGRVVDENGKPVPGVTVAVKGTNKQTITNEKGEFTLAGVEATATLTFSSINMEPFSLNVSGQSEIIAKLKTKTSELDEVQIIAYGQTTKRFQTGNVSTVKAADIEKQPVQNPLLALQGRVPGLVVTQNSGVPGGGVTVRIQGRNSIRSGNDPLYIIDGVPYPSQLPTTGNDGVFGTSSNDGNGNPINGYGNPLNYINVSDIESIEVLKDADATAIYGSRAANGVILITTKKGKIGQMKLDVNLQKGWGKVANKWDMLNSRQYLDMRYEALKNDNIDLSAQSNTDANYYDLLAWDTTRYTDWQKTLIGKTSDYLNLSGSVSGGTNTMQYLISGNYHKETTVFPGDFNDQKGALHFNINGASPNEKFRLQFTGSYMVDNNHLLITDLTRAAVQTEPVAPDLYNADGSLNWAPNALGNSTWANPLVETLRKYKNVTTSIVGNTILSYQLFQGLDIRGSLGYTRLLTTDFQALPLNYTSPENRATGLRGAVYGDRDLNSWIFEPQIVYKKSISRGKLDLVTGGTIQENNSEAGSVVGIGFNSDEVLENKTSATQLFPGGQYIVKYKYSALFGRFTFNWADKYIINSTWRRDGTSRFGTSSQFHNFGSIGGAWIFTEESWIKKQKAFSFGKLRVSYGTTGSDQIEDYSFLSLYNFWSAPGLPYQNSIGTYPNGIPNPYLEWEETKKLQTGVDLGFWSDRVIVNITHSRNRSSNQLLPFALPSTAGYTYLNRNFPATVQNTTWEFYASSSNLKTKTLEWATTVNLTIPKNKLVAFPDIETSSYSTGFGGVIIDQPIGIIKTLHSLGVDPSTGKFHYADKKGNSTSSPLFPDDYTVLMKTLPRFYGGIQNSISYKGLELDFLFQFVKQLGTNYSFNSLARLPGQFSAGTSNQPVTVMDRWQKPGDLAQVGYFTTGYNGYMTSDESYVDASYVRLKNVSLSYELPAKWLQAVKMKTCKVSLQGQNVYTLTKWKGLDPETQSIYSLPPLRVLTFGLKVGL
ncbi:hypothetical protein A4R26_31690 [Niastella populi]|uniref:TonB-dependent receptor plug domain-containing protein n=1 Tax=Niastella populi TaxID=550983 RepID=A0A1V9EPM1_9BACT|nr:hypothetical protein A4R26_31690 [Niastella populi]